MKCPYCNDFKGNSKVRGYPVKDQLFRHIEVDHPTQKTGKEVEMIILSYIGLGFSLLVMVFALSFVLVMLFGGKEV